MKSLIGRLVITTLLLTMLLSAAMVVSAQVVVPGNPVCPAGYTSSGNIEPPEGWDEFSEISGSISIDGYYTLTYKVTQGIYVEWSSPDFGIDLVMVKGGSNANVYSYDEATSGSGLTAPLNNTTPFGFSHMTFCWDYELTASKTANTSYARDYSWGIDKQYDGVYHMFAGQSTAHNYLVSVDQIINEYNFVVYGVINVSNNAPQAINASIADSINDAGTNMTYFASLDCGGVLAVPAHGSASCGYSVTIGSKMNGNNVATVTSNLAVIDAGLTVPYAFGEPSIVNGYSSVNVNDSNGQAWGASSDMSWNYAQNFSCSSNPADYNNGYYSYTHLNTAIIAQTSQSDSASVTVHCYAPVIDKTAAGSYDERHDWDVVKTVDPTSQSAFAGNPVAWKWIIDVTETVVDQNFKVTGNISVSNPAGAPGSITVALADMLNDGTGAIVDCGDGASSATVAAGATVNCSYTATPSNANATLNTVTGTFNGINFVDTADVSFVKTVLNDSATLSDTEIGLLDESVANGDQFSVTDGDVCSSDQADYGTIGKYTVQVSNTAILTDAEATEYTSTATTTYTCYAPVIDKTAAGSYDERHDWDVVKTVDPTSQSAFAGNPVAWKWIIDVTETVVDQNFKVTGNISVSNPAGAPGSITVALADILNDDTGAIVDCGDGVSSATVAAGATVNCSYTATPSNANATLNTVTGTFNGINFVDTADVSFAKNVLNDSATLSDTEIGLLDESVANGDQFSVTDGDVCSSDQADYGTIGKYTVEISNTAILTDAEATEYTSTATTMYTCYAPIVTKDAKTTFTRSWNWTIDKSADQTELTLSPGQLFDVNYVVIVDTTSSDSNWAVSGTITVQNPAPEAMSVTLADVISPDITATLDCGGLLNIPAGESATCGYSAALPDASSRTNTATATLASGASFSGSADVTFDTANPTVELDECVDVNDTNVGYLGAVCAADAPVTYNYTQSFGQNLDADVYLECGETTHINTADFVANDTNAGNTDDWTIVVDITCSTGCSLTPGYWKTHSIYGRAPYDDTWALVGEDTLFFLSGQSYYEVLWTPSKGNVYYNLSFHYIAAVLNGLNGADTSSIDATLAAATALFENNTPAAAATLKGKNKLVWSSLASTLASYNEGQIGPGHCDEDGR